MYIGIEKEAKRLIFSMENYTSEYEIKHKRITFKNVNTEHSDSYFIDNVKIYKLRNEEQAIEWLEVGTKKSHFSVIELFRDKEE